MSTTTFPKVTPAKWRELVEKELAGKLFDKTLVEEALPGIGVAPLYTEAPPLDDAARFERREPFRICMRHEAGASTNDIVSDATSGADALWIPLEPATSELVGRPELAQTTFVFEPKGAPSSDLVSKLGATRFALAIDPIADRARGKSTFASLDADLGALGSLASALRAKPVLASVVVSTEPYHDAGADAADEIALGLATAARYLETLLAAGLTIDEAAAAIALRPSVGRDTFLELCKLRALRLCFAKLLVASGASRTTPAFVHAVSSSQTLSVRDPWVNMLRTTTQMFAAILGGADLVTPTAFDRAFGAVSPLGHRVARNTGLVLREESALGKVSDPAGGSYAFDSLTDALARRAWSRFREITRDGGITKLLETGKLKAHLESAFTARLERIAKRRMPILGVSEFANPSEKLPAPAPPSAIENATDGLPLHRDAATFEALRLVADAITPPPEVLLVPLGGFAESRPRAGFAATFFAAGGMTTREANDARATVACLCGTDERYAEEAATRATELKKAGVKRVLLAGRPGALEASLREAGVDGFLFVGCDVVATLREVLGAFSSAGSEVRS